MIARGRAAAQEQPHSLVIEGTRVDLVLRRSARRSFALQVDHRGARVAVPLRAPLGEVERFVHSHGRWLLDRLQARAAARPLPLLDVVDGATVPLFGRALTLRLRVGRLTRWHPLTDAHEELLLPTAVDPLRALLRALQARAESLARLSFVMSILVRPHCPRRRPLSRTCQNQVGASPRPLSILAA